MCNIYNLLPYKIKLYIYNIHVSIYVIIQQCCTGGVKKFHTLFKYSQATNQQISISELLIGINYNILRFPFLHTRFNTKQ